MRLLVAIGVFLAAAVPALAASQTVDVSDDLVFKPSTTSVSPNETVTWNWSGSIDHTVTSNSRQIDRFRSGDRTGPATFVHEFKYAGRFRYHCEIHPDTMRGTVTVGTDDGIAPKVRHLGAHVSGHRVKLTFRLSERSVVTAKIGHRKKVKLYGPGKHAFRFRGLTSGTYRARLSAKDGFGHTGKRSKRFTIG